MANDRTAPRFNESASTNQTDVRKASETWLNIPLPRKVRRVGANRTRICASRSSRGLGTLPKTQFSPAHGNLLWTLSLGIRRIYQRIANHSIEASGHVGRVRPRGSHKHCEPRAAPRCGPKTLERGERNRKLNGQRPIGEPQLPIRGRRGIVRAAILLRLACLLLLSAACAVQEAKKIRVIGAGITPTLKVWFTAEPSTDPLIIPARDWEGLTPEIIRRLVRMYFPRTYRELLTYEFYFLSQVDMSYFSPQQQQWMYRALGDQAMGAVNTRSTMGIPDVEWRDSVLSDAFPNDVAAVMASQYYKAVQPGRLVIRDDEGLPNIMKPYKTQVEAIIGTYYDGVPMLYTIPRPGSVILSYIESKRGLGHPVPGQVAHVFYWKWNSSVTFTFMDQVLDAFWSDYWPVGSWMAGAGSNPYALDMVVNIIWFSTGRNLPEDAFLVHELRQQLFHYGVRKSLVVSLLEFAEVFGADTSKEYQRLDRIDGKRKDACRSYLAGEFSLADDRLKVALEDLNWFESEAARLKDRTLFLVYLIQWFVTTGAFLSAGLVLWTLMVRRRLYREVEVTRSRW